jgi:hypothetical protein
VNIVFEHLFGGKVLHLFLLPFHLAKKPIDIESIGFWIILFCVFFLFFK